MKNEPTSFRNIIDAWPSRSKMAEDLSSCTVNGRDCAVTKQAIDKWYARDSIPSRFWVALSYCAKKRRIRGVTISRMSHIDAAKLTLAALPGEDLALPGRSDAPEGYLSSKE